MAFLLFLSSVELFSQVNLSKFPANNQVLQRNEQDEAIFQVKGKITENGHSSISLKILQNGNVFSEQTLDVSADFAFSPTLKAGNFNYTFILTLDGTREIKKSTQVAVGDLFLIYGQSNALGSGGIDTYRPAENPLMRFFTVANFDNGDSEWVLPYKTSTWPGTGTLEFQKFLCGKYNYPVGVIVGSVGGSDIKGLNNRNPENPADKNTHYGKLLLQTIFSDVKDQIKYVIFRHGESDGSFQLESVQYPAEFEKLYNNLNLDFPNLKKVFNIQTNILTVNNSKAGFLRDYQRRTKYLMPKITTMSTVGTDGYDGLHYGLKGYSQTAYELARIVGREIYNDNQSSQVYSPDIKKVYWENQKLVLEFDEGMEMIYPQDSSASGKTWSIKDFIYVDGRNDVVQSGKGIGHRIFLTVANIENAKTVSYLPNAHGEFGVSFYNGVHLKNKYGMRAFSFDNVSIAGETPVILPPPTEITLNTEVNEDVEVKLTWNSNAQTKYHVERSTDNNSFGEIGVVSGGNYYDAQAELGKIYFYRVFAENAPNTKSNTKEVALKCLENLNLKTLPAVAYIGANISITTIVSITNAKQLSLEANKSIDLNHGFDAELGSDFSAEIGGCKNN
ncbi:sialate O-acetylesterase [Emticicia sp.]|uniref:sialate O-acetylesterase n=1 Tax=Emticicia sp. TaxID=1930953 RepID=UPI003BAA6498